MKQFLPTTQLFDNLVEQLAPQQRELWHHLRHVRVETGYVGRRFFLYRMVDDKPDVRDILTVTDFRLDASLGARMYLNSTYDDEIEIGYRPTKLWGYKAFMALPLHGNIRWSSAGDITEGRLGFPVLIKTKSRLHLREEGIDMVETSVTFDQEFGNPHQK